ncbi:hypothetical protein TBLA_0G00460 [Henningerozyma blattae CBS 6284]|uniref:Uncharacterized protein n=1 Tax=Henningerozyma blattae (strain ATCC 34711 / CBS 6284 / DSM 70876 / NBRC 10599 / NRRL Y-10934 / UCD 77-7) TaxID=1071380 RepID=I2H6J3_HENB6|nr:hypothetical protein TBLA_0G00460 [Tetrapisispora blattae CBS 6284]CCH61995.1 hypothetical protein TBLA_0G00460 [Tetrapisispora blattae CBS 6284]
MGQLKELITTLLGPTVENKLEKFPAIINNNVPFANVRSSATAKNYLTVLNLLETTRETIKNPSFLLGMITLGIELNANGFLPDSFWYHIFILKLSPKLYLAKDSQLLIYLFRRGMIIDNSVSWKCLALLSKILNDLPGTRKTITNMIRGDWSKPFGDVLDTSKDFQQIFFTVYLLAVCFPRKSENEVGIIMPPEIYASSDKNIFIFNHVSYPLISSNSSKGIFNFIRDIFNYNFQSLSKIKSITYSFSHNPNKVQEFNAVDNLNRKQPLYCQFIFNNLYIWFNENFPVEINRKYIELIKTLKGNIRITFKDDMKKGEEYINTINISLKNFFEKTKWLEFQFETELNSKIIYDAFKNSVVKISQAETYLLLQTSQDDIKMSEIEESEEESETITASSEGISTNHVSGNQLTVRSNTKYTGQKPMTPDNSSSKEVSNDIWDISNPDSISNSIDKLPEVDAASTSLLINGNKTQQNKVGSSLLTKPIMVLDDSPTVDAQKRKKVRAFSKIDELPEIQQNEIPSNPVISKLPSKIAIDEQDKMHAPSLEITNCIISNTNNQVAKANKKVKQANSIIGNKEITLLDSIFGRGINKKENSKTNNRKMKKKTKPQKQQSLDIFNPIVDVPSQIETTNANNITNNTSSVSKEDIFIKEENCKKHKAEEEIDMNQIPLIKKPHISNVDDASLKVSTNKKNNIPKQLSHDDTSSNSTTLIGDSGLIKKPDNLFTNVLEQQIYNSVNHFTSNLTKKINLINEELNHKIASELSDKYQTLFAELQTKFQDDVNEMVKFTSNILNMLQLPEQELVAMIRSHSIVNCPSNKNVDQKTTSTNGV